MRRALLLLLVATATLVPAVATATHIEIPALTTDCREFGVTFRVNYRSTALAADWRIVATLSDENGDEYLTFEHSEPLHFDGDRIEYYEYSWLWNDVTDDIIHLFGAVTVDVTMTITAPWGEEDQVDVHTVTVQDRMVCDVVAADAPTWSELKSRYR